MTPSLQPIKEFALNILLLIEQDYRASTACSQWEFVPLIPFHLLRETVLPQAFFKPIHWLDETKERPSLWVGEKVGYGMMNTIDWETWLHLESKLPSELQDVAKELLETYRSKSI